MIFNLEAWYNLTEAELNLLETIDLTFLRKLLQAPKGTPKEMLFLETGCTPFRELIRERRLSFLHYILNEDKQSMVHRFFQTQMKYPNRRDWVTTVLKDLEYLDLGDMSMEEINKLKKGFFMQKVKRTINDKLFEN